MLSEVPHSLCIAPSANCYTNFFYTRQCCPLSLTWPPTSGHLAFVSWDWDWPAVSSLKKLDKARIVKNIHTQFRHFISNFKKIVFRVPVFHWPSLLLESADQNCQLFSCINHACYLCLIFSFCLRRIQNLDAWSNLSCSILDFTNFHPILYTCLTCLNAHLWFSYGF